METVATNDVVDEVHTNSRIQNEQGNDMKLRADKSARSVPLERQILRLDVGLVLDLGNAARDCCRNRVWCSL